MLPDLPKAALFKEINCFPSQNQRQASEDVGTLHYTKIVVLLRFFVCSVFLLAVFLCLLCFFVCSVSLFAVFFVCRASLFPAFLNTQASSV